jgi:hypothetical protein
MAIFCYEKLKHLLSRGMLQSDISAFINKQQDTDVAGDLRLNAAVKVYPYPSTLKIHSCNSFCPF